MALVPEEKWGLLERTPPGEDFIKAELLWETPESGLGPLSGCRCPRGDLAAAQMVRKLEAQGAAGQPT